MKASLSFKFSQNLALTPQLQQSIKLLQLSAIELEQELITAAEQNPLIDYEPETEKAVYEPITQLSHRATSSSSSWDEDDDRLANIKAPQSLFNHLLEQIRVLRISDEEKMIMGMIAGNLDEKGYLNIKEEDLLEDLEKVIDPEDGSPKEQLNRALNRIWHLEPSGVGARDLAECLKIQLDQLPESHPSYPHSKLANRICADYLELLAKKEWARLKKLLKVKDEDLELATKLIKSLKHNPATAFEVQTDTILVPDVIVRKNKDAWQVISNPAASPKISLHEEYAKVVREHKNDGGMNEINQKLQEARWLVKNVLQRSETILKVAKAIVDRQQNFFNHGEIAMRPLVLREIADTLGMHESTISRVTTQKYMATPLGTFEFKYFFGSQVGTDTGGTVSSTAIRALIKQLVDEEDNKKPLSDTQIVELLSNKGFVVARRTIAKYRESLRIPAVHLRRK
jgi:RNA polymerase sigma-54 factor